LIANRRARGERRSGRVERLGDQPAHRAVISAIRIALGRSVPSR
jgi:hypothetical protein